MSPLWVLFMLFTTTDSLEIIKAARGGSVLLPCEPTFGDYYEGFIVKWSKKGLEEVTCQYFINLTGVRLMSCISSFEPSLHGLNVKNLKSGHYGSYSCLIMGFIPPPTLDVNVETMELRAYGLSLMLVNTTDFGCVELLCTMDGIDQDKVGFIWNWRGKHKPELVHVTNNSSSVSSSLRLCGAERRDGDTVTCSVSHPSGHLTSNWTIHEQNVRHEDSHWMVKSCIHALAGVFTVVTAVIIFKYKKRKKLDDAVSTNSL